MEPSGPEPVTFLPGVDPENDGCAIPGEDDLPVGDAGIDLSVESLTASDPFIVDEPNMIRGVVKNDSPLFVNATVRVTASNEDPNQGDWRPVRQMNLLPQQERAVTFEWDTRGQDNQPMLGELLIVFEVFITGEEILVDEVGEEARIDTNPDNNRKQLVRNVERHEITMWSPTLPQGTIDPSQGETFTALVWVENKGNADATVGLLIGDTTPGWSANVQPATLDLPLTSKNRTAIVTISGPPDAPEGQVGQIELIGTPQGAPEAAKSLTLRSPPVSAVGDFTLRMEPLTGTIPAGAAESNTTFEVDILNQRNEDVEINPVVLSPTGWNNHGSVEVDPAGPITVEEGENVVFEVTLTAGPDTPAGVHSFDFEATWSSDSDSDGDVIQAPTPFSLHVGQHHDVAISIGSFGSVEPGGIVHVPLSIENLGNGPDAFVLFLEDTPSGWKFVDANKDPLGEIPVNPDEPFVSQNHVYLETPSSTPPGPVGFAIGVRSANDTNAEEKFTHFVQVPQRAIPQMTIAGCPTDADCIRGVEDGEQINIPVTLRNIGNVDETFSFSRSVDFQGFGSNSWEVTVDPSSVTLAKAGGSTQAFLSVEAPSSTQPDSQAGITLTLSADNHDHENDESEAEITVLAAYPDLEVDGVFTSPSMLYRNLPGNLTVEVTNTGRKDSPAFPVRISYWSQGQQAGEGSSIATHVAQAAPVTVGGVTTVQVPVPTSVGQATLQAHVEVDPNGQVDEYDTSNNVHAEMVDLRRFDVRVTPPADMDVEPGQAISLEGNLGFRVENLGSADEPLVATLTSEPSWTQAVWAVPLEVGDSTRVGSNFHVPDMPGVSEAKLTLRVHQAAHPALAEQATMRLRVIDNNPPDIQEVHSEHDVVPLGTPVKFTAQIWDASGVDLAELVILSPVGEERRVKMEPNTGEVVGLHQATVAFEKPGEHRWYVWARDASPDQRESDTFADTQTILVQAESKPTARLLQPADNSVIRPGLPIVVSIANTTGIKWAKATVDGDQMDLPTTNPLQVATDTWDDGPVTVHIQGENRFAALFEATYQFIIDGTPPQIDDVRIEATAPKPGDSVQLHVSVDDDSEIERVFVRVEPGDGSATDVDMTRQESRGYTATITYPSPSGSITIFATDEAGNTANKIVPASEFQSVLMEDAEAGAWFLAELVALAAVCAVAVLVLRRAQPRLFGKDSGE